MAEQEDVAAASSSASAHHGSSASPSSPAAAAATTTSPAPSSRAVSPSTASHHDRGSAVLGSLDPPPPPSQAPAASAPAPPAPLSPSSTALRREVCETVIARAVQRGDEAMRDAGVEEPDDGMVTMFRLESGHYWGDFRGYFDDIDRGVSGLAALDRAEATTPPGTGWRASPCLSPITALDPPADGETRGGKAVNAQEYRPHRPHLDLFDPAFMSRDYRSVYDRPSTRVVEEEPVSPGNVEVLRPARSSSRRAARVMAELGRSAAHRRRYQNQEDQAGAGAGHRRQNRGKSASRAPVNRAMNLERDTTTTTTSPSDQQARRLLRRNSTGRAACSTARQAMFEGRLLPERREDESWSRPRTRRLARSAETERKLARAALARKVRWEKAARERSERIRGEGEGGGLARSDDVGRPHTRAVCAGPACFCKVRYRRAVGL